MTFLINKKNLHKTRFVETTIPSLLPGEVLLRVNKYAFTANNITYGVFGDRLYWAFFPGTKTEGVIPVWGFAEVVASNHAVIKKGERFYGYYPMGKVLKVKPSRLNKYGFLDVSPHRVQLPATYNLYNRTSTDPSYQEELEDYLPFFRPLFGTGFLAYHFMKREKFFSAKNMILTSASSKTALGLAFMLRQNKRKDKLKIIGLTSARNIDFVKKTGFYDEVIVYEKYVQQLKKTPSMVVDFSGNITLLQGIATHLGKSMKYTSLIGFTDWQSAGLFKHPKAAMFFAPDERDLMAKQLGGAVLNQRLGKTLFQFIQEAKKWMELEYVDKSDVKQLYLDMLNGKIDPSKGCLVS